MTNNTLFRVADVATLMRHAQKSATYKPALLKSLVRCIHSMRRSRVELHVIAAEFTKLYWNQTVIYHLRQAAALSKESTVVQLIRQAATDNAVRHIDGLSPVALSTITRRVAKLLQVNVLAAFHASKPQSMPVLYHWQPGTSYIDVSPDAIDFLRNNAQVLEIIANHHWASLLERFNTLAPRIIQKVTRDGATRASLQKYLRILLDEGERCCFYCNRPFEDETRPTVDHVLPWSFLLEDMLWNLVLACEACNCQKSDWLPTDDLLRRLLHRNNSQRHAFANRISFIFEDGDIRRLYEAAISVEWPRFWSPRTM